MTRRLKLASGAAAVTLATLFLAGNLSCATTKCLERSAAIDPVSVAGEITREGVCLKTFAWAPKGDVRGVVIVVHGIRDHASRYGALARALEARGFAVYSHDLRGHGHSGGARQRFDSMDELLADVDEVAKAARAQHPGAKVFVYGHSLGGLIAAHYALRHQSELGGVVLSGAALKLLPAVTPGQISAAHFFGAVLPGLPAQPVDDSEFVSTPEARAELQGDPLIVHGNLPARSARTALDAIADWQAHQAELGVSMLVMHGTGDVATNPEGSKELVERAKSTDKTLQLWDGQFHDLLHEPRRDEVIHRVVEWIEARAR